MNYLIYAGVFLLLFAMCFLAAGILGRGWFLWDNEGRNLFYAPGAADGLSECGRQFIAGVLAHLPALVALTCPSVNSYRRLQPQWWSSALFGVRVGIAARIFPDLCGIQRSGRANFIVPNRPEDRSRTSARIGS